VNTQSFRGVEFSIRGTSPSGRFGVSVGMLDTIWRLGLLTQKE
jgi:hypothetical protein